MCGSAYHSENFKRCQRLVFDFQFLAHIKAQVLTQHRLLPPQIHPRYINSISTVSTVTVRVRSASTECTSVQYVLMLIINTDTICVGTTQLAYTRRNLPLMSLTHVYRHTLITKNPFPIVALLVEVSCSLCGCHYFVP